MAYKMSTDSYTCDICGFELKWDASDCVHGSMWSCEKCESNFCSKCFVDRHGFELFGRMLQEGDKILCPTCWEDAK